MARVQAHEACAKNSSALSSALHPAGSGKHAGHLVEGGDHRAGLIILERPAPGAAIAPDRTKAEFARRRKVEVRAGADMQQIFHADAKGLPGMMENLRRGLVGASL